VSEMQSVAMNEKIRGVGFDKSIDLYQVAYPDKN
jgi:hypothetical protein